MSNTDFSNVNWLSEKVNGLSTGVDKVKNYDVRFANYPKDNGKKVHDFIFHGLTMKKTGLDSMDTKGTIVEKDGNIYIAVIAATDNSKSSFLNAPKDQSKQRKKLGKVSSPKLVKALANVGLLSEDFVGSQYFNLELAGETEAAKFFLISSAGLSPTTREDELAAKKAVAA